MASDLFRRWKRKQLYLPAHTCVDRPHLPCDACQKVTIPMNKPAAIEKPTSPVLMDEPVVIVKSTPVAEPVFIAEGEIVRVPHDSMTKLLSIWKFSEELEEAAKQAQKVAFIQADIDAFKAKVNDPYGHVIGDQLLVGIADIFRRSCSPLRQCVGPCRFGGEAFAVAITDFDDEATFALVEGMRQWIEALRLPTCPELQVTARFAVVTTPAKQWKDALQLADSAVYYWKRPNTVTRLTSQCDR